jgi:hypothetical protein
MGWKLKRTAAPLRVIRRSASLSNSIKNAGSVYSHGRRAKNAARLSLKKETISAPLAALMCAQLCRLPVVQCVMCSDQKKKPSERQNQQNRSGKIRPLSLLPEIAPTAAQQMMQKFVAPAAFSVINPAREG